MALKLPKHDNARGRKAGSKSSSRDRGRISLAHLGVLIFLLAVTLLSGIAAFFQRDAASQAAESWRQEISLTAENLADRIATELAQNTAKMELLTQDARLAELVALNNPAARQQREAELAYLFPNSVRVRILPPGLTEVDMNASPPLSYAALDMLRQAETGEAPPPAEVHLFGTPQQHITIVRRILSTSGRRIIGHLMVNYPLPILQNALDAPHLARGYGEVWQTVSKGPPVVLAKRGSQALRDGSPALTVDIPGSRWKVAYWSAAGGFTSSTGGLWAIAGSGILIFGLLLTLLLRSFGRALRQDQTVLLGAVRDARSGRLQPHYALQLRECSGAIEGIRQLFDDPSFAMRPASSIEAPRNAAAAPTEDFPTTGVDKGSIDVNEVQIDRRSSAPTTSAAW
jgi:phosphomannomutase / phosphoglucomutase